MPYLWHLKSRIYILCFNQWYFDMTWYDLMTFILKFKELFENNNFHRSRFKDHHRHININEPNFQVFVSEQNCPENEFLWWLCGCGSQPSLWYLLSWTFREHLLCYSLEEEDYYIMNIIRAKLNLILSTWIHMNHNKAKYYSYFDF